MCKFKTIVQETLIQYLQLDQDVLEELLEKPQNPEHGHLSLPCFAWAKTLKKAPNLIAQEFCEKLKKHNLSSYIDSVNALGPYLNFKQNQILLGQELLQTIINEGDLFAKKSLDAPPTVVLEFSSPNIAKPLSIGHLRTTNIGACLARVFKHQGWNVIRINHLGDWGTQFGKVMLAFRLWGNAEDLEKHPIDTLYKLYVKFHEEEKKDPSLADQAREWFAKLEQNDETAKELWQWFKDISLKELNTIYQELGVEFDHVWGESFYVDMLDELIVDLKQKNLLKDSQDAKIVDLKDYKLGVSVIQKKDESSLYMTRDLAAAQYRYQQFHFDEMLYVVGNPQKLHFQQLFKVLELLGCDFVDRCHHVAYGHVDFGHEKMSTRKGNIVLLKEVIAQAKDRALSIIEEKNATLNNKQAIANAVGLGAVLFADLNAKLARDVKFTWDEILNFEGETGPYLQYGLVRAKSVLEKYEGQWSDKIKIDSIETVEERSLLQSLNDYPQILGKTLKEKEPFYLSHYALELVKQFNRFYAKCRVLDAPEHQKYFRLCLVKSLTIVLESSLKLLGVPRVEKM
ncbi:arginine--tRNA ligase [bacterium]|nr:arginine--tRNA ligase [bacterium]